MNQRDLLFHTAKRIRFRRNDVLVESGAGKSTEFFEHVASTFNSRCYSCDISRGRLSNIARRNPHVICMLGDSLESLWIISCSLGDRGVRLAFLDSCSDPEHTLNEFLLLEKHFRPGSLVVIDNAKIPGSRLRKPCRKGLLLVPYLQERPEKWKIIPHPAHGDGMICAVHKKPL